MEYFVACGSVPLDGVTKFWLYLILWKVPPAWGPKLVEVFKQPGADIMTAVWDDGRGEQEGQQLLQHASSVELQQLWQVTWS